MKKLMTLLVLMGSLMFALTVPDFQLLDFSDKASSLYALSAKNKLTVVSFVSTTCGYCHREMSDFNVLSRRYFNKGVGFSAVFLDNDLKSAKSVAKELKITYPALMGVDDIAGYFKLQGVPYTIIIDKDGALVYKLPGYVPLNNFDALIKTLLENVNG